MNLFEPELVVVGGGVSRAGEQLLGPVRGRWVLEQAMGPAGAAVDIVERGARRPGRRGRGGGDRVRAACPESRCPGLTPLDRARRRSSARIDELLPQVDAVATRLIAASTAPAGGVYTFGNGGSAADAQHLAEELRRPLPARAAAARRRSRSRPTPPRSPASPTTTRSTRSSRGRSRRSSARATWWSGSRRAAARRTSCAGCAPRARPAPRRCCSAAARPAAGHADLRARRPLRVDGAGAGDARAAAAPDARPGRRVGGRG